MHSLYRRAALFTGAAISALAFTAPALAADQPAEFGQAVTVIDRSIGVSGAGARAYRVTIDTETARAVLDALSNPVLVEEEARRIARLHGSQMIVRKVRDFSEAADEDRFAEELLAAAHLRSVEGRPLFGFESARDRRETTLAALRAIEGDKAGFVRWIEERVRAFAPRGPALDLHGYLIAGGNSTGFTFGGRDFYLNLAHFDDEPTAVKVVAAHELYHGVQGAAIESLGLAEARAFEAADLDALPEPERDRRVVEAYLWNLMTEGVATYVGDPSLLTEAGRYSQAERKRLEGQVRRTGQLTALLDMALVALTADPPMAYEPAYGLGYYGPDQPLYYLGYTMAKAIADRRGTARLGELITGTGCGFVREYLAVAASDPALPQLGSSTLRLIHAHCD